MIYICHCEQIRSNFVAIHIKKQNIFIILHFIINHRKKNMKIILKLTLLIPIFLFYSNLLNAQTFGGGNGTQNDPFRIYTIRHLQTLSEYVKYSPASWSYNKYFILMNNITDTVRFCIGATTADNPPYYGQGSFFGIFDGQGYFINVGIDSCQRVFDNMASHIALFPFARRSNNSPNGMIKNLVVNGYVNNGTGSARVTSGIVGQALSSIHISVPASTRNYKIINCINNANVTGNNTVAGIVGLALLLDVENCINLGVLTYLLVIIIGSELAVLLELLHYFQAQTHSLFLL